MTFIHEYEQFTHSHRWLAVELTDEGFIVIHIMPTEFVDKRTQ